VAGLGTGSETPPHVQLARHLPPPLWSTTRVATVVCSRDQGAVTNMPLGSALLVLPSKPMRVNNVCLV
jgi:hypothetical protein